MAEGRQNALDPFPSSYQGEVEGLKSYVHQIFMMNFNWFGNCLRRRGFVKYTYFNAERSLSVKIRQLLEFGFQMIYELLNTQCFTSQRAFRASILEKKRKEVSVAMKRLMNTY